MQGERNFLKTLSVLFSLAFLPSFLADIFPLVLTFVLSLFLVDVKFVFPSSLCDIFEAVFVLNRFSRETNYTDGLVELDIHGAKLAFLLPATKMKSSVENLSCRSNPKLRSLFMIW